VNKVPIHIRKIPFRHPWHPVSRAWPIFSRFFSLEAELKRELIQGHVLYHKPAYALARRHDTDDVLFYLPNGPAMLAEVHLTYSRHLEKDPFWPATTLYQSIEDWLQKSSVED
jgi:hypothetical protein